VKGWTYKMTKKALGKGLGALLNTDEPESIKNTGLTNIKINELEPNLNQPRKVMNDTKLKELSDSIKNHGIVQPIIVNNQEGIFRIVAGERRWRAARMAGLTEVPVIIKELTGKQSMEIALIENLQREDLNPLEEAEAYERLIKEHDMTHEELSNILGKSRPAISNSLRLLTLCQEVKNMLIQGIITSGHARALITIADHMMQTKIAHQIISQKLSVRETENLIIKIGKTRATRKSKEVYNDYDYIVNNLQELLGTKVKIKENDKNMGKITIEYYSKSDLERIVDMVTSARNTNIEDFD
jgi:ParB family chromosome partitioning protein